jgi:hypothetical protein
VGLLRWMRGNDDSPSSALSAGLMDIGGIFHQPTQRKQTELIHEQESKTEHSVAGAPPGVDLDAGTAIIRRSAAKATEAEETPA